MEQNREIRVNTYLWSNNIHNREYTMKKGKSLQ